MSLKRGASQTIIGSNIKELHTGKTYAHTEAKFGKAHADRQAVAIALNTAGKSRKPAKKKSVHFGR